MFRNSVATAFLILLACGPAAAQSAGQQAADSQAADNKELNLLAYGELLRSDVRTEKVAILTQMLHLTESEDAAFWPVYREYDVELSKLGDARLRLIQEYANNYDQMTDEAADKIALQAIDLENQRDALKAKYYDRMKKVVPAKTAARFLQVENQLQSLIDLQIASSLPVVK